ncbi:FAD-binding protein [Methylorubrum extorquens]|uniref:FAD-binding protein n=1 Tax=Methylorubrum extorquens TaxID=408 RepID=UPI00209D663C|nr:FAD-binding protein [Methylorubrum extorquens]
MQVPDVLGSSELDVAVIGAGAAGFAAARQLAERRPALRVVELDIEFTWGSTPSLWPPLRRQPRRQRGPSRSAAG